MTRTILLIAGCIILRVITGCSGKGPDSPVLLLATDAGYGTYTGEILRSQGFNEFVLDSLSGKEVTSSFLSGFDLVILAESTVGPQGKEMIREYVKKGGNLIAFCPDRELAELFGILPDSGNISEGYIRINTATEQGKFLTGKLLQFHGTADKYSLDGGIPIATLLADKVANEGFPAVVSHNYEKGHTVAFLYNLPKSIVYTRQGNPLFAGIEKDSIPGLRGMDMFTDGWVDTSNNTINQADVQMTLFSHCIEQMSDYTGPLPRFWYFPDTLKCLVTLTNDGEYKIESDFEPQFRDVDSLGAKMSIYIIGVDKVSKAWVDKWTAKGFEIAGHPDDTREAVNPRWNNMDSALRTRKNEIAGKYGLPMRTNVNHWFVWCGFNADGTQNFGAEARLEEKNGIEMDINYAHYDMKSNQGDHYLGPLGTNQGNFTGSGQVMKFADISGKIINVYQHFNAVYDQEYNESHDPEGFYNCFKGLMDRSLHNEVYSFISVKSHNDEYYFSKAPLMKMLAYANKQNVPVWTELKLLDFIKMKDQASFTGINWKKDQLSFNLNSSISQGNGLTFMVPFSHADKKIVGITINSKDQSYITRRVNGSAFALSTVQAGENYSVVVKYGK
jgi:large repetitive protein